MKETPVYPQRALFFGDEDPEDQPASLNFARSLAVVAGINDYRHVPPLRTAAPDAEELARILQAEYGYETQLLTQDVTLARFQALLAGLRDTVGPDDRVVFYFAGHGIALEGDDGPAGYLVPQDGRPEDRSTFLRMDEFHDALMALPCRHMLIILDCCFAGAMRWASTRALSTLPEVIHKERYERFIRDPAWQVITSAAYDQKALDVLAGDVVGARGDAVGQHSPFALALFEALHGAGDVVPVGGGDGVITAAELYLYLRDYVEIQAEAQAGHYQTPGLWPLKKHGKGEYIFLTPGHALNLPPAPELSFDNNPYRGLQAFEEEHAPLFFGRTALVETLAATVARQPLTVVLGASGTGKSSVVKAGLLPYLRGTGAEGAEWLILPPMRPTESPLRELASLLQHHLADGGTAEPGTALRAWGQAHPGQCLLLVVDQFEELITLCRDDAEREQFLAALEAALTALPEQVRLILTLRSDFEPQFAESALQARWTAARFVIPPMTQAELREAIEGPAGVRVLYFEPPALVERLIDEVIQTPGALPLLSFTLSELYIKYLERRGNDRALSQADYEALGGVVGSLRSRATEEYTRLPDAAHQATMQRVMLRMVASEGGELARRRVPRAELVYPDAAENARVNEVIQRLDQARLVVSGKTEEGAAYVEPAHDALVRAWDKLLTWHREAEDYLPLQRRLTQAAGEWAAAGDVQTKTDLLWNDDPRLPQVEEALAGRTEPVKRTWAATQWLRFRDLWRSTPLQAVEGHWLNELELDFVRRSVAQRRKEGRRLVSTVAGVMVILVVLTLFALFQSNQATLQRNQAQLAATQEAIARQEADESRNQAEAAATQEAFARQEADESRKQAEAAATQEALARQDAETAKNEAVDQARAGRILRARQLAAYAETAEDPTGSLNLMLARESALTTWLTDTTIITHAFATNETLAALNFAIFKAQQSPWQMTLPWRTRHTGAVVAVAYSPDGTRIISGSADQTVRVWDAATGAEVQKLTGHTNWVLAVAYSPDGTRIVSGGSDNTVRVWNARTGTAVQQLTGHTGGVNTVAYSPDGTRIVSGSTDQTVRVWDTATGGVMLKITGHTGEVNAVAYSPDGTRIASGSTDQTVRVWDAATGVVMLKITGHTGSVNAVAYSPDGTRIVSGGGYEDQTLRVWDAATGKELHTLTGHTNAVNSVAYSPDGKYIISGGDDRTVQVWDAATGKELQSLSGHTNAVKSVAYSPDGTHIVSGGWDNTVRVWDAATGQEVHTPYGHANRVNVVAYSPDGKSIVSGGADGTVQVWDAVTGYGLYTLKGHTGEVTSAAYSPDGKHIASSSSDGIIQVWDAEMGQKLLQWVGYTGTIKTVVYSPDGTQIVSTGCDEDTYICIRGSVKVWDAATGVKIRTLTERAEDVFSITYSPDGTRIVGGSWNNTVRMWDAESGAELAPLVGHTGYVYSVAYSPDGTNIVSGGNDGTVRVWDTVTGQTLHTLTGHFPYDVDAVAYSPDGMHVISVGGGTVRIWDAAKSQELQKLGYTSSSVLSVAYSPDGSHIVIGEFSGAVQVWDVAKDMELQQLVGHTQEINVVAYSPDGTQIVSSSDDQTVRVWDVATGQELQRLSGPTSEVNAVVYSPDGTRIAGAGQGIVWVWDATTGQELQRLAGHEGVSLVAYSPDGTRIVSGGWDNTLRIWDATTGKELHSLVGHTSWINAVAYSPDGTRIVSGSADQTVRVWDAATGRELQQWAGHTDPVSSVNAVAYSPDGTHIVSGGYNMVRVWDAATGQELQQLTAHIGPVNAVAYSPDGTRIVGGGSYMVQVWDAPTGQELHTLTGHTSVWSVAYSPDGTHIVSGGAVGMTDQTIWIWNTAITLQATADRLRLAQCTGHDGWVRVAAYNDKQPVLIASDDKTRQMFFEDADYLLSLAGCLIQRDPPIFVGEERSLYRFDEWSAFEH